LRNRVEQITKIKPSKPNLGQMNPEVRSKAAELGAIGWSRWAYVNHSGQIYAWIIRFDLPDGKTYRPIRKNGRGFVWNDPDGEWPLYNLQEVEESTGPIFLCEGEKCADILKSLGLVATTSKGGANGTSKTDWSPLAEREVRILPDAGDPDSAGAQYRDGAIMKLFAQNPEARVRVVNLPDLADGQDVEQYRDHPSRDCIECRDIGRSIESLADDAELLKDTPAQETEAIHKLEVIKLANVTKTKLTFLLPDRIPENKITMIYGRGGVGKSTLTLYLAAMVSSNKGCWMNGLGLAPTGQVLIMTSEDDASDTIIPRLEAAGANIDNIDLIVTEVKDKERGGVRGAAYIRAVDLAYDMVKLRNTILTYENPKLLILDPLTAFLGRADDHKNSAMRAILGPLAKMAAELKVTIIGINHMNKTPSQDIQDKQVGSVAFDAQARSCWVVAKGPGTETDPELRYFLPVKHNLAANMDGLGLEFKLSPDKDDPNVATVNWLEGPAKITAQDLGVQATSKEDKSALTTAKTWLLEVLGRGPQTSKDLFAAANNAGIARSTLKRARGRIDNLRTDQSVLGRGGVCYWSLDNGEKNSDERLN